MSGSRGASLRSFADAGDEDELTRDSLATKTYRAEEPAPHHDTDEMLDRVSRSGQELNDVYRRIEEQLRGVARRMETTERSQSENNRALSKAATEMNIATREQAQAFDQLGAHVVGLASRLENVERSNAASGMKDAIKGLHTGLSRLADQITQNAGQSATQISSLADNLEAVAGRLGQARSDAEGTARSLESRMASLDDRIYMVEKAAQSTAQALERALEKLDAHAAPDPESERREAATAGAIARLEENVSRLETRGPDPDIDRRLTGIERNLGDLVERFDGNEADDGARHRGQPQEAFEPRRGDGKPPARHGVRIPLGAERDDRAPCRHRKQSRRCRAAADGRAGAGLFAAAAGFRRAALPRRADARRAAALRGATRSVCAGLDLRCSATLPGRRSLCARRRWVRRAGRRILSFPPRAAPRAPPRAKPRPNRHLAASPGA